MTKRKSWEDIRRETEEKRNEERKRFLAMSDRDAEKLPVPDRYQRLCYLRDEYAAKWLADIRRKLPAAPQEAPERRKRYGSVVQIKDRWND